MGFLILYSSSRMRCLYSGHPYVGMFDTVTRRRRRGTKGKAEGKEAESDKTGKQTEPAVTPLYSNS